MLNKYIFSNINDGLPKKSCRESLDELISNNLKSYLLGFVVTLCEALLTTTTYMLIILVKLYKKCCSKKDKQKKREKEDKKRKREEQESLAEYPDVELELEQQNQEDTTDNEDEDSKKGKYKEVAGTTEQPDNSSASPSNAPDAAFPSKTK